MTLERWTIVVDLDPHEAAAFAQARAALRGSHHADLHVRKGGHAFTFSADWLRHALFRPQREESDDEAAARREAGLQNLLRAVEGG
jgi:hypothetical protein